MRFAARLSVAVGFLAVSVASPAAFAPAAHASPVTLGVCVGQQGLVHYATPTVSYAPLTDQTQTSIKVRMGLLRDDNNAVFSGGCAGSVRPGDRIHPAGGDVGPLTPVYMNASLTGNLSCANGSAAQAADGTASAGWWASGAMTWTMQQHDDHGHPYRISALVTLTNPNFDTGPYDTVTVTGIVRSGVNFGATVSGTLWMDPVKLDSPFTLRALASSYSLDLTDAANCADPVASNASVPFMMFGGGDGSPFLQHDSSSSLLGTTGVPGITFTMG